MGRPVSYSRDDPPTSKPELDGFQHLADGINLIGYANRKRLRRREWHRVTLWVKWKGRRTLEITDLVMVEDRSYTPVEAEQP